MTPAAKKCLSETMRGLRERLLMELHDATESRYRLQVRARDAELPEAVLRRRQRLEGWVAEQVRSQPAGGTQRDRDAFRREAEKQAAYTLLNRLVLMRLLEAAKLRQPAVVTGGWQSSGYLAFRELAPALVHGDETEGYAFLLQLVFEEVASELPGLFGPVGVADLIPIPPASLRHVVEALDDDRLESCWSDDMTLGWIYQYWNDPEREAIDAKLNDGGKVEPHEIASKTQMFTERYMVDWLLQNSLGPMWLAICGKHGWTPEVTAHGILDTLEQRRVEWRAKRDAGEVSLTELMPLHSETERRWAYYVPQPIPDDAIEHAPDSVRDLQILDPAVGSGHFLVVATDLLFALYQEEARHRGETDGSKWSATAIVERILSHNLHGIDLDPRAVQIAAAALWLKAKQLAPGARPERLNLVASNLRLASLDDDDPALVELRRAVEADTGIPGNLTDTIVHALHGADHLGSLLKIDRAVEAALDRHEQQLRAAEEGALTLFDASEEYGEPATPRDRTRLSLLGRLEEFLTKHTTGDDLGLRLRGEQLAAGVRFMRLVREGKYDLVMANPPYQGTSKMAEAAYIQSHYPLGKADLYAAFLLRGLELVRHGGTSAMLTMRNWMFIKQYAKLRERLLVHVDLRAIGDFDRGAFEDVPDEVVSVTVSVYRKIPHSANSIAICPTPRTDRSRDGERTRRKRAATLCHVGRHEFDPAALKVIPEWPLVYWWNSVVLQLFRDHVVFGDIYPVRQGIATGDDTRFTRLPFEPLSSRQFISNSVDISVFYSFWAPLIMGASGRSWQEPLCNLILWSHAGLEKRVYSEHFGSRGGNGTPSSQLYFNRGVAFSTMGQSFRAREHRFASIFGVKGCSVFPDLNADCLCLLNRSLSRAILQDFNPGMDFTNGDVERLPVSAVSESDKILGLIQQTFTIHESHREPSVEFKEPGASPWRHAQEWAQMAVDRAEGEPLPPYEPEFDAEPTTDHLSFALGVALGRFGPKGEGILDPSKENLDHALPNGICFLDGTLGAEEFEDSEGRPTDSLGHPAAQVLHEAWATHGGAIGTRRESLREWLALDFFGQVHRGMYENRPIHWPLTSASKSFVAWVNIHRLTGRTLKLLLSDHLVHALKRIAGRLEDVRKAREAREGGEGGEGGEKRKGGDIEREYDRLLKAKDELERFIRDVTHCADKGPPAPDAKTPEREVDAAYDPDLDDGVMINAAALWPLLDPQWRDPKSWWKELASAKGKKDYDWSHLAMRYWPTRVDAKCQADPSLGVAHGCFWAYHPARAWAWELRLQDEIAPDFRIAEPPYRGDGGDAPHRERWLTEHRDEALSAIETEANRRHGRGKKKQIVPEMAILQTGFWSEMPERCWELELAMIEKQEADFSLRTPDESAARAAFEKDNPEQVERRQKLLDSLDHKLGLFGAAAQDNDDEATEAPEDDEQEEDA